MHDSQIDPMTLSTIWHRLQTICREMAHVVERTCQNYLISQLHDISVGIWDAQARTVAIPVGLSVQYLGGKLSVAHVLDKFKDDLYPGDVIILNDPYNGFCCHLPDWGFYRPIFYKDELVFFTICRAHQMDTGGAFPGGYFPNGYDIHAEGLRIPPTKIISRGREVTDIFELLWNNVRWPEGVRIDNYAMIASTQVCEDRINELMGKYGKDAVLGSVSEMIQRTERAVRRFITEIPDGTYRGEAATDDDGTALDEPVWVRCDVTVKGDELSIDFSRSDAQRKGFVNAVYNSTFSNALSSVLLFMDAALTDYHNEGSMRPIDVIAPPGLVVNARYPATVGASPVNVGHQIIESVVMAMSNALPRRAVAAWGKRYGHYIFGNDPRTEQRYVVTTFDMDGGAGAVHGFDGYEGAVSIGSLGCVNRGNVEEIEQRFPWQTQRWEFAPDSAGAGKWRGASGMYWEVKNEGSAAGMATGSSDGEIVHGPGALGGQGTPNSRTFILRDGERIRARNHRMHQIEPGDALLKVSGGGAGVGSPLEREPEKVLIDVINEFISIEHARDVYGVVIDADALQVDEKVTQQLRDRRRADEAADATAG